MATRYQFSFRPRKSKFFTCSIVKKIHFCFHVKKIIAQFYFLQKATSTAHGWPRCRWIASSRASHFRPWPATAMASSPRRGTDGSLPRPRRRRWAIALRARVLIGRWELFVFGLWNQEFLLVDGNSLFSSLESKVWICLWELFVFGLYNQEFLLIDKESLFWVFGIKSLNRSVRSLCFGSL